MLGDGGVGKSCLSIQLCHNYFTVEYDPTIENSYRTTITVDDEPCLLEVLDTAGQEDFIAMRDQHIRYGEGFALVYSITLRNSFLALQEHYDSIRRVKEEYTDLPMVLFGNKCDCESQRQVSVAEGRAFAKKIGAPFFETSAKTRFNVDYAFEELIRLIRQWDATHKGDEIKSQGKAKKEWKKGGPCVIL